MYKIAICDDEDALIKELKDGLQRYAAETGKEFCYFAFHDKQEASCCRHISPITT